MRFDGTSNYIATQDLKVAVNAAVTLRRPLLVKGEPGTGKTVLAQEIAKAMGAPLIEWNVKSTTKAQQRGGVDRDLEVIGGDIVAGAFETLHRYRPVIWPVIWVCPVAKAGPAAWQAARERARPAPWGGVSCQKPDG